MLLTVNIKNPPNGATKWYLYVIDWNIIWYQSWGVLEHNNIEEEAVFDIPYDWVLPLRIDMAIHHEWQEDTNWYASQVYRVQSWREYVWDEPDPSYKPIFIPYYGIYNFNVATEEFEVVEEHGAFSELIIKDLIKV